MRTARILIYLAVSVFLMTSCSPQAQKQDAPQDQPKKDQPKNGSGEKEKAAKEFVQSFYDWYVPKDLKRGDSSPSWDMAISQKSAMFDADLLNYLNEEQKAEKKSKGDLEDDSMDFDPFLNAQDMAEVYTADKVTPKGDSYWVEVYGTWNGEKSPKPDVIPEVALKNGNWVFVNFHYLGSESSPDTDLIADLKGFQDERQKH